MATFTVSLKAKTPAKKPLEVVPETSFVEALKTANHMTVRTPRGHYVEITNEVGEVLAKFPGGT